MDDDPLDVAIQSSRAAFAAMQPIPLVGIPINSVIGTGEESGSLIRPPSPLADQNRHPFEVYVRKYPSAVPSTSVTAFVAWGTVCRGDEKNVAEDIETELNASYELTTTNCLIYLVAVFNANGSFHSLDIEAGLVNSFACSYVDGPGAGQNTWYHPIAHYRACRTGKSTANSLDDAPFPDSGEFPDSMVGASAIYTIAQLTNTHLVGQQMCMTDNGGVTRTAWKLVPGPGAITGTGA